MPKRWGDIGMRRSAAAQRAGELHELERLAAEQASLRRVATMVARERAPGEVFSTVAEELRRLLDMTKVRLVRFEPDGTATLVASQQPAEDLLPVGTNTPLPRGTVVERIFATGRPASVEDYSQVEGPIGQLLRQEGVRRAVGAPVVVDGRLWGAMVVGTSSAWKSDDAQERLAQFAELVSMAISNIESRTKVERLVAEQSALRRVATLVADERPSDEILASLAEEIGVLFDTDASAVLRYESDFNLTVVARWGKRPIALAVGQRFPLEAGHLAAEVLRTGMPARKAAAACEAGIRSAVASPIFVEGATWGTLTVISLTSEPFPPDTEARLAEFSRHAGVAVANAKTRSDLTESRARIVRTADVARRRFERDLHDGAQQRLVSLGLELSAVEMTVPPELDDLRRVLATLATGMNEVLDDLRELSRGLHPAVLSEDGLTAALSALALRSPVPVELRLAIGAERFEEAVEVAAYYVASEALTNAAKHARASRAEVRACVTDGSLQIVVSDDGQGGADASRGSGLTGLRDRVEALGGTIRIESHHDLGTAIQVRLPTTSPNN
jgi:signal transduction histidine kinase